MPEIVLRDPRIDPRVGDVLRGKNRKGFMETRKVNIVSVPKWVRYQTTRSVWLSPDGWQRWAASAEVIRRAEDQ